jgi:hypothetical protein
VTNSETAGERISREVATQEALIRGRRRMRWLCLFFVVCTIMMAVAL